MSTHPKQPTDTFQQEHAWLASFNQALDSLDIYGRWAPFWSEDAFVQFANFPKAEGKPATLAQLAQLFRYFCSVKHTPRTVRVSIDTPNGLIYHTASVSMKIKGDPRERVFTVPALTVLHKRVGERQTSGMEVYIDIEPAKEVLKELEENK